MQLAEILHTLDAIAPPHLAQPWDNVGLLAGDPKQEISRAMLCIDYTEAVAAEAAAAKSDLVIAYHPPLFKPVKRMVAGGSTALVFDAIRRGVAIYSPHTALDVAEGGTNDVLADALDLIDRAPLQLSPSAGAAELKLITFTPIDAVDRVADALFAAGAGRIGDYSSCSFRSTGTGTFKGDPTTNPTVGQAGKFEAVEEIRLETIVPQKKLLAVIEALRAAHPYETPAFDLIPLATPPQPIGIGRIGRPKSTVTVAQFIEHIKSKLALPHLLVAQPAQGNAPWHGFPTREGDSASHTRVENPCHGDDKRQVQKVAVCAGSCGEFLDAAIAQNVDVFVTGELRHHDALKAAAAGMTCVCTLHSNSERITLASLARRLADRWPAVRWDLSQADRDPFQIR